MLRRIYIIEFPRTFSEKEMDLQLTEIRELSGIFNWAMEGYNRLRENSFRFREASSLMKTPKQKFKNDTNSAFAYVQAFLAR